MKAQSDTSGTAPGSGAAYGGALEGYQLPALSTALERALLLAFVAFIVVQVLEAPLRYWLSGLGAGWLIYLRDVAMLLALLAVAAWQLWRRCLQGAFVLFAVLLLFHGTVSFLMCDSKLAVLLSMKTLLSPMFAAIFLPVFLKNRRDVGWLLALLALVTAAGIVIDFAGWNLPWKGASESIGDYRVVINKKWNYLGDDRVAGFARDSVGAAMLMAFFGTYALLFSRSRLVRAVAAAGALVLIYLTTSKGCVVAFALVILACMTPTPRTQLVNKLLLCGVFAAMMLLPVILPNYAMPSSPAFLRSFFDRAMRVWPDTWHNIGEHSWLFGSGLGNVGVGQQYLRYEEVDPGDNLFVLAYGYFGVFALAYLTLPFLAAVCRRTPVDALGRYALVTLIYVFTYGIVVNIIEGPVAAFMLGGALQALAMRRPARAPATAQPAPPTQRLRALTPSAARGPSTSSFFGQINA
jgi:hypothetical protein